MARASTANLTEADLLAAAGEVVFGRGEDYVRYVHGLVLSERTAQASIQARNVYLVDVTWTSSTLDGSCTCPHFGAGNFCKHLSAVGLAAIDATRARTRDSAGATNAEPNDHDASQVTAYLAGLNTDELRALVGDLAARDPDLERWLMIRAAAAGADPERAAAELTELVRATLRSRGFIDYRRSFDVAADAERMLAELEEHLDSSGADVARPALLLAVTKLRTITLRADDSGGVIGSACQRALDLYARSCREGKPERAKLARWLLKFRDDSPGWPDATLADFAPAFDTKALAVYRTGVHALDAKHTNEVAYGRFEVDRMLLELADHDEDVDLAIDLLSHGDHVRYGGIVDRLRASGRDAEVIGWIDRAVADGRLSSTHGGGPNSPWLSPQIVADTYLDAGRPEDAIQVLRTSLLKENNPTAFSLLVSFAERLDRAPEELEWALGELRAKALGQFGNGAVLIAIALSEGDLTAAWAASDAYGPGYEWERLAKASRTTHPREAAELYLAQAVMELPRAESKIYPKVAALIAEARDLYASDGDYERIAGFVADVRSQYGRRPAMMAALDRKRL